MNGLRRGFKAEAERIAADIRRDLALDESDPLCPWKAAGLLGFDVLDLSAFEAVHPVQVPLVRACTGPKGFSAVTVHRSGYVPAIVLNDGHGRARQAADLAHELAHGLLLHPPEDFAAGGRNGVNALHEEEAKWLGPALLVPNVAARRIVRTEMPMADATEKYGVSVALMQMRLQVTGALRSA